MKYKFFLKKDSDFEITEPIKQSQYMLADVGSVTETETIPALDRLFEMYNFGEVKTYHNRCMSVGDIVELIPDSSSEPELYACARIGWKKVEFVPEEEPEVENNIADWFNSMIDREIEETKGTISNEQIWANGSEEDVMCHTNNAAELMEYIEFLKKSKI